MKIVILGGDGFCGWATSLYLSARGHEIIIVDNLSRRDIDNELGVSSLTPIAFPQDRIAAWKEVSNNEIKFHNIDVAREYDSLLALLKKYEPDAIVHFAEQRAAPYSMRTPKAKRYTVDNNTNATHNLLCATVESKLDIHLVHLGTMGVYGYGKFENTPIPEGYLKVQVPQPNGPALERDIMYPADPGSVYHMTKTLDALLFYFYNKNDKLRVTDLHQGIVWGTATDETARDERLINRFDYDGDYGTVLNRFLMQAAIGYPLTVHGTGGQKRAFIHIRDSARCIDLALQHPPKRGDRVQIFNQMTETHRVGELAEMVSKATGVPVQNVENPRNEVEYNELNVTNDNFLRIGLEPIKLSEGLAAEVTEIARKYAHRVDRSKILATSRWR
jgi:UDP-sulfoquinovose synthase